MPANFVTVRDIALGELTRFPGNARRGDVAAIRSSLRRHGQYRSLVVRDTGSALVVLAGNHTRDALDAEGQTSARCEVITCTDDEARRINLADNRLAELGGYEDADLAALLTELDGDFDGTGWAQEDLDALLAGEPESRNDPDDVPDTPAEPVTRPGDVWLLGPHRLLCGDSTDPVVLVRLMGGEMADLVWTDPPYGVAYTAKNAMLNAQDGGNRLETGISSDELDGEALAAFLRDSLGNALAVSRPGASWWVAAPGMAQPLRAYADVLCDLGVWRHTLVWVKDGFVLGRSDYHGRHEQLLYGWAPGAAHHPPPDRSQDSVWEIPRPLKNDLHPTMKPVALIERAISNHTSRGAVVLDPFGGAGSTLIAAHQTGRVARLVELDPAYCDVICQRYADHTGTKPQLMED